MASANTNSSIMGRQRNNVNVAMNNDMGELQYTSHYIDNDSIVITHYTPATLATAGSV
jgi:hypothetical protein